MRILAFVPLVCLIKVLSAQQVSDNDLYPPSGVPLDRIKTCDFRKDDPCRFFFNYLSNKVNFALAAEDRDSNSRSIPTIRYITTGKGGKGEAQFGSRELITSTNDRRRALCVSFRYRLTGDASLSLVEKPRGKNANQFWTDAGRVKDQWRFHTSQISQDVPTKIIFVGRVNGGNSAVAITDITLYNSTCTVKDGDSFVAYTGASRALTDAPYWSSNATIPYEIQAGFTVDQRNMISRFFSDASATTCLRFVPRSNFESSYMNFIKADLGSGCSADLGNVGQTKITLDDGCFDDGYWNIAHMIMHGLGIRHEHVRPDRDNYVRVLDSNIDTSKVSQFAKRTSWNPTLSALPYDFQSIMHFSRTQYAYDGYSNTIERLSNPNAELSNRFGPTPDDFRKIAALYCNGATKSPTTPRPTQPTTTSTTTPRPAQATPCTGTTSLERSQGTITNTMINGVYRKNENCGWLVTVPDNNVITMRFTYLELEDSEGCAKDVVTIYDGDSWETSPIIADLCGYNRPVVNFTTTTNKMLVILTTDSSVEARGFSLAYQAIAPTPETGPSADAALSPVDCNFDSGTTCGWAQATSDLQWQRTKKLSGLPYDRSTSSSTGSYVSLDASTATASNQFGIMRSSRIQWADAYACFSFWYRFVDASRNIGKLQVTYATSNGDLLPLWSSDNPSNPSAYSQWVQVRINVYDITADYYRLILNGTIFSNTKTGGIAVDDIILTQDDCSSIPDDIPPPLPTDPPTTQAPINVPTGGSPFIDGSNGFSCDFETNYCQWRNGTTRADSNWLRASGRSTAGSEFGVQTDRTRQTPAGRYLLLNYSPNAKKTARVEANIPANSGYKCFEFYYMMFGEHLGRINIIARTQSGDEMVLFEASGNKPNRWQLAQASVDGLNQAYTLIVEGYTTGQVNGDIGIDDFLLRTNDCYSDPLRQIIPTTTPYSTPDYPYLCDFEDGQFCTRYLTMSSDSNADLQFTTASGGATTQAAGGPLVDHSQNNTRGRFAATRGGWAGAVAAIQSKQLQRDEANCMNFWYFMGDADASSIKISVVDSNGENTLYTIGQPNRFTNQWINPQVKIPSTNGQFTVKFTVTSGGSRAYTALDDVELSRNTKCSLLSRSMGGLSRKRRQASTGTVLACRFADQSNPFCGWTNNGKWQAVSTSAQADLTNRADDRFAHVTSGRLVVAAGNTRSFPASADMTSNITGVLTSPTVNVGSSRASQACVRFFYKISGWFRALPMDTLNVYVQSAANPSRRRVIASLSASQTPITDSLDDWVEKRFTIFEQQNYQLVFEATTGDSWIGSIAIDELQLRSAVCPSVSF